MTVTPREHNSITWHAWAAFVVNKDTILHSKPLLRASPTMDSVNFIASNILTPTNNYAISFFLQRLQNQRTAAEVLNFKSSKLTAELFTPINEFSDGRGRSDIRRSEQPICSCLVKIHQNCFKEDVYYMLFSSFLSCAFVRIEHTL